MLPEAQPQHLAVPVAVVPAPPVDIGRLIVGTASSLGGDFDSSLARSASWGGFESKRYEHEARDILY